MTPEGPPTARRPGLTRDRVLQAALTLTEREGARGLTMRALGRELGVEAMSLYNHVPSRDVLLDGLGELLMAEIVPVSGTGWRSACETFAGGLRATALAYPQTFGLVGLRPLHSAPALAPVERLLGDLVDAGATPATALVMYRTLASHARGFAMAEVSGFTVDGSTPARRRTLRALPAAEFPVLRGRMREFQEVRPDEAFAIGLGAILDGFAGAFASAR